MVIDIDELIADRNWMCRTYKKCSECPLHTHFLNCDCLPLNDDRETGRKIGIILDWAKNNPVKRCYECEHYCVLKGVGLCMIPNQQAGSIPIVQAQDVACADFEQPKPIE